MSEPNKRTMHSRYTHAMIAQILKTRLKQVLLLIFSVLVLSFTGASVSALNIDIGSGVNSDEAQGDVFGQDCAGLEESIARSVGCNVNDEIVDVRNIVDGELSAPSQDNLNENLTRFSDARSFIQGVVNFALSFLGLISVVMVIYGGAQYVLSRGDEDAAAEKPSPMP